MSVRLLSRIKLAFLPHLFQPFAHHQLNVGHSSVIAKVDHLHAKTSDVLIVGALAHHLVGEDLFATP